MDLLHPSGTHPAKVSGTPSLLIQLELVDKTTLSMRMRDPSEKIHSQIRRPSFSDSLLTLDSKRVLTGPQKHYLGPKRAFPRTRRVSDSKMLPTSGQDSFCRSNNFIRSPEARAGRGGTPQCVSRQVCIAAVSGSVTLSIRISESPTICCMGKTRKAAPKSAEGTLRGWETIPFMQPSTIRRYCAHHSWSYFSHPDEEGERQFRFDHF